MLDKLLFIIGQEAETSPDGFAEDGAVQRKFVGDFNATIGLLRNCGFLSPGAPDGTLSLTSAGWAAVGERCVD